MKVLLNIISGICWALAYLVAIIHGFKHKTWCIPKLAICQNFAWEFWIVVLHIVSKSSMIVPFVIQLVWLVLDVGVLLTWLLFDRDKLSRLLINVILFASVMAIMYVVAYVFEKWLFVAFFINLIMSIAFVIRVGKDRDRWMSRLIGFSKLIGTLAATIMSGLLSWNPMILWIGGLCFLFDIQYLSMCSIKNK